MKSKIQSLIAEDFSLKRTLVLGIMLGFTTFWNGSMVLSALMILGGLFIFSHKKIELILIAIITLTLSFSFTHFFVGSNVTVKPDIWYGMLSKTKDLKGITIYYLLLFGIMPLVYIFSLFIVSRPLKILLALFIIPFLFANIVKITPDVNANHKFILVFQIATSTACALVINYLLKFNWKSLKFVVTVLIFLLTCTGVYDFCTFYQLNNIKSVHYANDPIILWTKNNTDRQAIFLTPMVATHPILLAGRNIYFGWPYFAWSAGYNVTERMDKYKKIYTATTQEELQVLLKNSSIDYILHEPRFMTDLHWQNAIYYRIFRKVYQEADSRTIYQVPKEWSH